MLTHSLSHFWLMLGLCVFYFHWLMERYITNPALLEGVHYTFQPKYLYINRNNTSILHPWKHFWSRIWKFRLKEKDVLLKSKPTAKNLVVWHWTFWDTKFSDNRIQYYNIYSFFRELQCIRWTGHPKKAFPQEFFIITIIIVITVNL